MRIVAVILTLVLFQIEALAQSSIPLPSTPPAPAQPVTPPGKGMWLTDFKANCKVWNNDPDPRDQVVWSGTCTQGLAHGGGTMQWFVEGKPLGQYDGDYVAGRMTGKGWFTWANGEAYDGDWKDDRRTGRGIYTWPDGSRYEGEWRNDKANGQGTKKDANGKVYSGTWINGCYRRGELRAVVGASPQECGFK